MSRENHKDKKYSKELKERAVKDYLSGGGSYEALKIKYGIINSTQLKNWVKWYNGHKEIKERSTANGEINIIKGRKTTQEERTEIEAFCLEHGKYYGLTVETYKVSVLSTLQSPTIRQPSSSAKR